MKRTYEEAIEVMVNWWVDKIQQPLNQNNGDNSDSGGLAFALMNMVSMYAQEQITDEKIEVFKSSLKESLLEVKHKGRFHKEFQVDYHPGQHLSRACEKAGINPSALPCKTFTFINNENEIEGRYQYGGAWFKI